MKKDLCELTKEEILALNPLDFSEVELTAKVIIAWAKTLGCYWKFKGTPEDPDVHAILKSEAHSDEFFYIREILEKYEAVRKIFAQQLSRFIEENSQNIYIVGIPDGATMLARDIAEMTGFKFVEMKKDERGRIRFVTKIPSGSLVIFVEDVSTQRTAVREAFQELTENFPDVQVANYVLAIIDRAKTDEFNFFIKNELVSRIPLLVKALVNTFPNEWNVKRGEMCPLCQMGSRPMKPKTPAENWKYFQ